MAGTAAYGHTGSVVLCSRVCMCVQKMEYMSFFKVPSIYSNSYCLRAALDDAVLALNKDNKSRTAVIVCTR